MLLGISLPHVPIVRFDAPFQLDFHTDHFIFDFLKSEELDPKNTNPAHPVFNLQNGTHLWYEIQTTGSPGISLHADQPLSTDPTSVIFVPAHLLPPDDAIPLEFDIHSGLSLKYTVEQVNTTFNHAGQYLQIVLNPYTLYPASLDIMGYLLAWIGEDPSGAAIGLMTNDGIKHFVSEVKSFKAFSKSVFDFIALLKDFAPTIDVAKAFHDAQTFLHDLVELCKETENAKVLGQLLSIYTGGVIPSDGILAGLKDFAKRYNAFETLVGLAQSIEDNFIVTAGYLVQQDNFPEVTLQTLSTASTTTPTPTLSQLSVYVSSRDGNIYALNASNGNIRWKYATGSQYISPVQVVDGVVYFIVDEDINTNPNAISTMYVLNEQNGTVIHRYNLPYFTLETGPYIPSFQVVNGNIYFSSPQMAFAINGNDGALLWKYSWFGRGVSDPVVINNVIYYVTGVGVIYALKNTDGTLLWQYDLGPDAIVHAGIIGRYPAPVVINNTLYVVGWLTDNLYAININTHALRWHIHLNNAQTNTLQASNNILYVGTFISPNPSIIFAVRADTGMLLWSKQNIEFQLVNTDALYCTSVDANGGSSGDIYALHPSDGTTIWHIQMSNVHIFYTASIQKTVYMSSDTTLYALNATNGSVLWQVPISGSLTGE